EMVMRIEESINLRIRCEAFQRGKHLVAILWRATVDEDQAVSCGERHNVCSAAVEDGDLVCLSAKQRRKAQRHRCGHRALQYISTVQLSASSVGAVIDRPYC